MELTVQGIRDSIGAIPDYPKPGIIFRDITPLLQNPAAFELAINTLKQRYKQSGITQIAHKLIKATGAEVEEAAFVVSLPELGGEDKLQQAGVACYTLCQF